MDAFDDFRRALAKLGEKTGLSLSAEENHCSFTVDESVDVNLEFLEESVSAVLWAAVGVLPNDGRAGERAMRLLEMNEPGGEARGFTLAMDEDGRVLVAHARRDVEEGISANILAAWIDDLVTLVENIREEFAERYPFIDDTPIPEEPVLMTDDDEPKGR